MKWTACLHGRVQLSRFGKKKKKSRSISAAWTQWNKPPYIYLHPADNPSYIHRDGLIFKANHWSVYYTCSMHDFSSFFLRSNHRVYGAVILVGRDASGTLATQVVSPLNCILSKLFQCIIKIHLCPGQRVGHRRRLVGPPKKARLLLPGRPLWLRCPCRSFHAFVVPPSSREGRASASR